MFHKLDAKNFNNFNILRLKLRHFLAGCQLIEAVSSALVMWPPQTSKAERKNAPVLNPSQALSLLGWEAHNPC